MYRYFQVCSARMADFRRKFSDAARRYIHLSYEPAIHPTERLQSLKCAMICAILSQAGECTNCIVWKVHAIDYIHTGHACRLSVLVMD